MDKKIRESQDMVRNRDAREEAEGSGAEGHRAPAAPHRPYLYVEDDRSYYLYPQGEFGPRREAHRREKRWYNQRWVVAAALLLGVGALVLAMSGLAQEVSGVNASIQEQTAAIEAQTNTLSGLQRAVGDLTDAVAIGFERLVAEIRAAASSLGGGSGSA